jgi:hypothetical protein
MNQRHTQTDWITASTTGLTAHDLLVERRLTIMEQRTLGLVEANAKMDKRLTLQERGMVLVILALNALAHEKLPEWAKVLASTFKLASPGG